MNGMRLLSEVELDYTANFPHHTARHVDGLHTGLSARAENIPLNRRGFMRVPYPVSTLEEIHPTTKCENMGPPTP